MDVSVTVVELATVVVNVLVRVVDDVRVRVEVVL